MTPSWGVQPGDGPIAPFVSALGQSEPLVSSVNLWSDRARAAQADLARRLREDADQGNFRERFGRLAAERLRRPEEVGFQIHQAKLHDDLKDALQHTGLAWEPGNPEPYDRWAEYVRFALRSV